MRKVAVFGCTVVDVIGRGKPSLPGVAAEHLREFMRRVRDERYEGNSTSYGRAIGMSQSGVSQLLASEKNKPSFETAVRVAEEANVPVWEVLGVAGKLSSLDIMIAYHGGESGFDARAIRAARSAEASGSVRSPKDWYVFVQSYQPGVQANLEEDVSGEKERAAQRKAAKRSLPRD